MSPAVVAVRLRGRVSAGRRERAALEEWLWRGVAADPVVFLGLAKTLDPHAPEGEPAPRPFPVCAPCGRTPEASAAITLTGEAPEQIARCAAHGTRHKPYLVELARTWQASEITLLEKARQLLISWLYVLLHLHLAMTRPGTLVGMQSLNYEKACALLERMAVTYATLPVELQRYGPLSDSPKAEARHVEGLIEFRPIRSRIMALPNGPHQVRMHTFTALFMDECQFWEPDLDFEDSYGAALATVKGGGRMTCVSSVNDAERFHHKLATRQVR